MTFTELKINTLSGLMRLLGKLPLKFHYFWGDIFSWILNYVVHYRKEVVLTNIARSFPEMSYADVKKTAKEFYRHFGELIAEAIWFGGSDYKRLHKTKLCNITDLQVFNDAYNNAPSITVLGSHCGNWELIGGFWSYNYDESVDYPDKEDCIRVVYKKLRSPVANEVINRNRCAPLTDFEGMIETNNILRHALKNRDKKFVYIYYTDQYPYATPHDIGMFMNQKSTGMLGGAALANKLGMSVVYMKMKQVERGRYDITFIPICHDASKMTPDGILKKYFELLEEEIREQPYNWLWSHKRWK